VTIISHSDDDMIKINLTAGRVAEMDWLCCHYTTDTDKGLDNKEG